MYLNFLTRNILVMLNKISYWLLTIILILPTGSCRKFVEVDPPVNELVRPSVFKDNSTANAAQLVIYTQMTQALSYTYLSLVPGILSDELVDFTRENAKIELYTNGVLRNNSTVAETWATFYKLIYEANAMIEGLNSSTEITNEVKKQITGEALFIRSFLYFYLVNFFDDIPYIDRTEYVGNAALGRTNTNVIYDNIVKDLISAKDLLNERYVNGDGTTVTEERLRPNKAVVTAFLARVYLYLKKYDEAIKLSSDVLANSNYVLEPSFDNVFLKNSKEAIWQLSCGNFFNTFEGFIYVLYSYPGFASMNRRLVNAFSSNDLRRLNWIGVFTEGVDTFYYPYKYKIQYSETVSEYVMVLRLSEQYLIRSEAKANLNDVEGALSDLNIIRNRAGLGDTLITLKDQILNAILEERRKELFTEWGHRWLDLKRTGKLDEVMPKVTSEKGGSWQSFKALMPIPQDEIMKNRNLTQNDGY